MNNVVVDNQEAPSPGRLDDLYAVTVSLQNLILKNLAANKPLAEVAHALCLEIERIDSAIITAVIRVDQQKLMDPLAMPSLPPGYAEGLRGGAIGPHVGTSGQVMTYKQAVFTPNIDADPNWREFRHLLASCGVKSCLSHPIQSRDGTVLGSLTFFYREIRDQPPDLHRSLIEICLPLCVLAFEREELQQSVHRFKYFDELTGLLNRATLAKEAQRVLADAGGAQGDARQVALLLIDLDHGNQPQHLNSHAAGNELLRQSAVRLGDCMRSLDLIGRLAENQFLAVISQCEPAQVTVITERILKAFDTPVSATVSKQIVSVALAVRIGVAFFPENGDDFDDLLRHAEHAMLSAKENGGGQVQFYRGSEAEAGNTRSALEALEIANPREADDVILEDSKESLYGEKVAFRMAHLSAAILPSMKAIIDQLYFRLEDIAGFKYRRNYLSSAELDQLKAQQIESIQKLCSPELTSEAHRIEALRLGHNHAVTGMSREDLACSHSLIHAVICRHVDTTAHAVALTILGRRLAWDLIWQMESSTHMQSLRNQTLKKIMDLVWRASSYNDLIKGAADILGAHGGIAGAVFTRVDQQNFIRVEALAGGAGMAGYVKRLERQQLRWLEEKGKPFASGVFEWSLNSGAIERCLNYATDERAKEWLDFLSQAGFVSSVAIPLIVRGDNRPTSILLIYSRLPGGFSSLEQEGFFSQIQSLLILGINRLNAWKGLSVVTPYSMRRHWRWLLANGYVEMHYQPVVELASGRITKVEALARLRDGKKIVMPGEFCPTLLSDDFLRLYIEGLNQVLQQRARWVSEGIELDVAINLPIDGLVDPAYFEATAAALRLHACPPSALSLEILETEKMPPGVNIAESLRRYKALGVSLAEDDLGSGYSSLARLRELPFDIIKIDRSIVRKLERDPSSILRFIYQLTRLGQTIGKKVVAEGIEDLDLLEAITVLGTDCVQGYVFAKPMPANELGNWFRMSRTALQFDCNRPLSTLGKLARLLIWEEGMALVLGKVTVLRPHAAMLNEMCDRMLDLFEPGSKEYAEQIVVNQCALQFGLRSQEYELARNQLVLALMGEESEL